MDSRYCRPIIAPDIRRSPDHFLEFLLNFGRGLRAPAVLFPTGDPAVVLFSRARSELSRYFRIVMPAHSLVMRLLTKDGLASLARERGVAAPQSLVPGDRASLEKAAGALTYPVILKPAYSHAWLTPQAMEVVGSGTKAVRCERPEELLSWYDRLAAFDPGLVVQELIPGSDERLVYFCFYLNREGAPLGIFAGRKLRVLPPGLGSASVAESMDDPELTRLSIDLLTKIGYRGLGGVEFKRDPRDGVYKLIEFNARFGLWDSLGARCGVNLAYIAYRDALGLSVEPRLWYRTGVKWISFERDAAAYNGYRKRNELTAVKWLRSLRGEKQWAVLAWDDPRPFLSSVPTYLWSRIAPRLPGTRWNRAEAKPLV
jgi:predicted ATP-grasp superfamily ATP-dependent carboligase